MTYHRLARATSLAIVCLFATTGCKIGSSLEPVELQASLPSSPSFGTGSAEAVETGWLASFEDEYLTVLVMEAMENNPNLQASAARVEAAAGFARQAGALLSPTVSLGAGGYEASDDAGGDGRGAALEFSWEVDIWGRLDSQAEAAASQYLATELTYVYARQSLAAQVAKSWFFCIEVRDQLRIAERAVVLYTETSELTTAMYDAGLVTLDDTYLANADLASAEEARREATGAEVQARRALEVLLGRYPSSELEVSGEFPALTAVVPVGLPAELLERRADIVSAERRVASAFEAVNVAKAARLPRLALTAQAGVASDELLDPSDALWNVAANLFAPLFDGGFLESEEDIATAEQKEAVAAYKAAGIQAFAEVENALTNEATLRERETFLVEALDQNSRAWELAKARFEAGEIDLLDVLQLQRRVLNARVALVDIRGRRRAQRVDLHLSLGGNFEQESDQS